eukprot:GHVU01099919.1.p2 GENE.GHVU01099919.1~~GHVU01099919.1.p2  ORF type:complete len:103 (-),score=5.99 GHVU01099919.1:480-788(-)
MAGMDDESLMAGLEGFLMSQEEETGGIATPSREPSRDEPLPVACVHRKPLKRAQLVKHFTSSQPNRMASQNDAGAYAHLREKALPVSWVSLHDKNVRRLGRR